MYRLSADRTGRPHIDREMSYHNSEIPKPSQVDAGSGATPTIPPGGLVAITDNADPMDGVVYRTATRLRHHQHRVVCQVPVFAKSASASPELIDRLQPLTERREQLRLPGPVRPPHRCDHTAGLRADGHQQARQRLRAGVDKPHRERPQRGYQSSPRQPRLDRALGASASGAKQSRHRRRDASQAWPLPDNSGHLAFAPAPRVDPSCGCSRVAPIAESRADATLCRIAALLMQSRSSPPALRLRTGPFAGQRADDPDVANAIARSAAPT